IGASMYACLSGGPPQAADQRMENDTVILASERWIGQYSKQLLETIDLCMQLNHLKRPQSVFALQKALATWDREHEEALVAQAAAASHRNA
ncbi:hypothetical protein OFC17_31340, partial [Escherichia coli]|nr:hypothetical protein [Escherichia coli]